MTAKDFLGTLLVFSALTAQFLLASFGIRANLVLAALVALSLVFDLWATVLFALIAVLVLNWQPAASLDIVLVAVLPIAAHFSGRLLKWRDWTLSAAAIISAFLLLYILLAPAMLLADPKIFFADLAWGLFFGIPPLFLVNACFARD